MTDDTAYRNKYSMLFKNLIEADRVKFGSTTTQDRIREGASWTENEKCRHQRETATSTAIVEWLSLAQCNDYYFTKGSTVTYYVKEMNASMFGGPAFGMSEEIGEFEVGSKPTANFRNNHSAQPSPKQ